ncbi:Na+ dependent nucleoside transporter [Halosquirtibacter laminarini]|uniref:Na+ dependent nucleoside transporter n=1 Tax=Halosquirtibacter laminarini TaxID=3374600 RepID=A0AC61NJ42_9BACT|nr:Na+ dependent nucleoside transporter [Prolixibacteraceae bacterium]
MQEVQGFSIESLSRGGLGMLTIILIAWLFSTNRKQVDWKLVIVGISIQIAMAIGILYVPVIQGFFEFFGKVFVKVLDFTRAGSGFLLGDLLNTDTYGFIFAFQVLPTIIFFSALTSLMFYLGVIQKVVYVLAWGLSKALKISGMESLSVAGNIFLGQTESPLMIKAYLSKMNRSEIFLVMVGGMATLAGGVLAAYIDFLGGDDPAQRLMFAKHLLSASVMAAPGAVVVSKIIVPQTEETNTDVNVPREQIGTNALDAISNGTVEGVKLAVNVAAMLLVFLALIAFINYIFGGFIGRYTGLNDWVNNITNGQYQTFSLQFILGYLLSPLMWLLGVCKEDITLVGRLLGEKVIINEFIGYASLADLKAAGAFAQQKSIIMATYLLCGFANFGSIGIQIGGIGALAPDKRAWLSEYGLRALLAGTLASCLSATVIGMIMG